LEEINLSDYLGENIIVRFQLRSDGSVNEDGFYFDDLTINIVEPGPLGVDGISTIQFSVYPNPVEDLLNITTSVSNYTIELYSLQGTLVERIENNEGSKSIDYSNLASGVYIVKLISGEFSQTVKIVRF